MRERDALQVTRVAGRAAVRLKSWQPGAATFTVAPDSEEPFRVLQLGPGEWLAISDAFDGTKLQQQLERSLRERGMAVVDLSQGLAVLRVAGPAAREVLSKGCGLDMHSRSFPAGHCARTRFAQLPVIIE